MSVSPAPAVHHRLSAGEKIGYALGDTAANFVWRAVIVFLPIFLTDAAGISPAAVAWLLLICRFWDGATDLAMGVVADRTSTRWGKFRPWILWTAVPFAMLGVLTFTAPDFGPGGRLAWAYVTYSALILLYTMNNVPYNSLMGVMSADPAERGSISSYRFFFAFLGGLFLQGLTPPLMEALSRTEGAAAAPASTGALGALTSAFRWVTDGIAGVFGAPFFRTLYGDGPAFPYAAAMTFFAIIAVALFVVAFATTRERVAPTVQASSLRQDLRDLASNRPWLVLFAVGILFVTFATLKNGATMYYFAYYVGDRALAAGFMVTGLVAAMAGAALTGPLGRVMGKRNLMLAAIALGIVASLLLYLPGPDDIALLFTLGAVVEFSTGPMVTLFFAMLADTADLSEWENGRRATGLFYSAGTVAMKFGSGVGGAVTGWLLAAYGYAAAGGAEPVVQSREAVEGIRLLISIIPAAVAGAMFVTFLFYRLDEQRLRAIVADLELRRGGPGSIDAPG